MKKVNFVCPKCGCEILEEFFESTDYWRVVALGKLESGTTIVDADLIETVNTEEAGGYRCNNCDFWVGYTPEQAYSWLAERGMIEDD